MNKDTQISHAVDVVLVGAGIMSATLGTFLKLLRPDLTIEIFERLDVIAGESSDAWNNAGTGHSAFCELNYTPEKADGSIDISKALKIAEQFEVSKQFWSYMVEQDMIDDPRTFINSIPHMSFVWGDDNVNYLRKRHDALIKNHLFEAMQYSEERATLEKWIPLVMEGRDVNQKVAATKMDLGTDVNFGALTRALFNFLQKQDGVKIHLGHEIRTLQRDQNNHWYLIAKDPKTGKREETTARFVFIGAGGGALPLLEKSGIPEAKGYGGFPVSGQWLRCTNEEVIERHHAKVYGKASVGAPPMSVPHLDTRTMGDKHALLFGPYAGFSTKFLKEGSFFDLPASIKVANIRPMLSAGLHNIPLTKYLIEQVRQSPEDRLAALKEYFPEAKMEDWELAIAGQRVQVIKKDKEEGGVLEFGTEIVSSADGSIAALLGASPGASTSVPIMLDLINRCFKDRVSAPNVQAKLKEMIPSYGQSLANNKELAMKMRARTSKVLQLTDH
ncbi:malate:quinone oxidoreductase [Taibaiella soli]|uniref:Probable malate:quinone oxidoreductase n=1 Tax=Taibaiella soli TaxID=1649169 RepID=A0A2W2B6P4_9BACT|nr:malate:quinone oxidoreductase [Taibaiella soli]PZF71667.1 malate:quinone oxidoreductase [Taibaiella soli]